MEKTVDGHAGDMIQVYTGEHECVILDVESGSHSDEAATVLFNRRDALRLVLALTEAINDIEGRTDG